MKKALVISVGWEQQPLIQRLQSQGYDIYGIHPNGDFPKDAELADVCVCDVRDLSSVWDYASKVSPDLVIADQCDYSHYAQAVVSQRMGLPGPSIRAAHISCNKFEQRTICASSGFETPKFFQCKSPEEADKAAREIGFPLIVKPVDNRGSFGVNRVDSPEQVRHAYWDAVCNSHSRYVLLEEFIHGVQITVDGYAFPKSGCRSLALATKTLLDDPERQVAVDIIYPGELPKHVRQKAMQINEQINTALGYDFGMTHSEYMVTEDERIILIESANRGGGCFTSELIAPTVSGIDLVGQYISDTAGETQDLYTAPNETPTILKFITFPPGQVKGITGTEAAMKTEGTLALRLQIAAGSDIQPVSTDANRHGFIIFSSETMVRQRAIDAFKMIDVTYDQVQPS
ncbi:carbamoyl-phosphate synthase large chain [Rhodopirellula maiorica SM1]|uniref:Carbamoyl-phosphate synthase large chain n=1 Tax=Rhodopirellula maiorica SM1 TaxID=1265738 RepID=M5RYS0_9BACT|nr:ATP-grasp domain-containing protein [Rhodopirellula maiorica]EMI20547.1 carbamoyl-phosphate synthase large chain [Rhodopirellula maiorica SM1]